MFGEPSGGILFQVRGKGGARLASEEPNLMFNENVVYFDRYAAYFTACLLSWLEQFGSVAHSRLGMMERPGSLMTHFGFEVLARWLDELIDRAKQA